MGEPVHAVYDVYDDPTDGIADFEGRPHHFRRKFDDASDNWCDVCRLIPILESTFQLAMEQWQIYLRWEAAYVTGEEHLDTHPARPKELERYNELDVLLQQAIRSAEGKSFEAKASFVRNADDSFTVTWVKVTS